MTKSTVPALAQLIAANGGKVTKSQAGKATGAMGGRPGVGCHGTRAEAKALVLSTYGERAGIGASRNGGFEFACMVGGTRM